MCVCVGGLWKLSCMLSFPGNLNSFFFKINSISENKCNELAVRGTRHHIRTYIKTTHITVVRLSSVNNDLHPFNHNPLCLSFACLF